MQALLGSYRWDWEDLRGQLPGLAAAWIPDTGGDLIGPGIAIDESAHIKHGDATACVAPQHAGCTGQVENCVTTVFSAYVTANGQAWADFDVYMPDRWARDMPRRRAAGIPGDLQFATKPQLAERQLGRLLAAGLPARWVAFDEVYGRSEELRKKAARAGLSYVAIIPCDYPVPLPSGAVIRADQAVAHAVFERRSCGNGSKGPRYSYWAMTATGIKGQYLLIRRLISRPDQLTFHLCWAPPGRPATMTYFITIAGRRWPVGNVQNRKGRARLGPDPGPELDRHLPPHCPGRPRPAPGRRHPQRGHRPHPAPRRRPRHQRHRRRRRYQRR
jgi:DDE superfamily endonuclease